MERKYNRKIFMDQYQKALPSDLQLYTRIYWAISNIDKAESLESFIKLVHKLIQQSAFTNLNLTFSEQIQGNLKQSVKQAQAQASTSTIIELISSKFGVMNSLVAEMIFRLHLSYNNKKQLQNAKEANSAGDDSNVERIGVILHKLRFEIQFQNMSKMSQKDYIVFEKVLQSIYQAICSITDKNKSQALCMKFYKAISIQAQNIPDKFILRIQEHITRITNQLGKQKMTQMLVTPTKYNNGLDWINQKQSQLLNKHQNWSSCKQAQASSQKLAETPCILKAKPIHKIRTIYHSRKNMFVSRKKLEQFTEKSSYSNNSTQWCRTISNMRRPTHDFNQDFQQDVLVMKTPKPNKFSFATTNRPIQIKLNFFD